MTNRYYFKNYFILNKIYMTATIYIHSKHVNKLMLMAGLFVITSEDGYSQKMVSDDG